MRKRVFLAWLLVAALALTTSCSLIVKDAEVDQQTVIVEVAGKAITKGEIVPVVQNSLDYQEYIYSMYGMSFDKTSRDAISDAQDSVIDSMVQEAVLQAKQAEMGLDSFTEEELAQIQATAESTYQSYEDTVRTQDFADTELTGEELDAAVAARMTEYGYPPVEELIEEEKLNAGVEKLRDEVVKDVAVTEDELKAEYDSRVEAAKTEYEATPASYGSAISNGTTVYYVPAGYRYVKHILREFAEEDSTKIGELESELSSKQTQLSTVETSLADLGEDASQDDEQTAQSRQELTDTQTTLNAEISDLQVQVEAARETAYANLQPTIEEIQQKLANGEAFDALIIEYGQDPGMENEPAKSVGYPVSEVSTNWVTEFTTASMALEKVGDVSEPVRSSYGIHIIQYVSDATEGPVAYDEVKDALQSELLTTKQDELYNATVEQWVAEAGAKIYKDRLAD